MMNRALLYGILKNKSGAEISASGNPAVLEGTVEGRAIKDLKAYGWSRQNTTTGAQLFEPVSEKVEVNGITVAFGEDAEVIRISGTATANTNFKLSKPMQMKAGDIYVLKMDNPHSLENIWIQSASGVAFGWNGYNTQNFCNITVPASLKEDTECVLYGSVTKNSTYDCSIEHLMINAGTKALSWEPYTGGQPSPNPDYPQEIENAGMKWSTGAQLLDLQESDIVKSAGMSATLNADGSVTVNGTPQVAYAKVLRKILKLDPGIYMASGGDSSAGDVYGQLEVKGQDGTWSYANNKPVTIDGTEQIVQYVIQTSSRKDYILNCTIYPMLNSGATVKPHEPYTGGIPKLYGDKIGVTVHGKNLFDFSRLASDGVNAMDYEKQTITVPAKTNNTGYNQKLHDLCPNITPGNYVLSAKTSNPDAKKTVYCLKTGKNIIFNRSTELNSEDIDSRIGWYNNVDSDVENVISEIQIEAGSVATTYEPYHKPQSLSIQTPNGLPGIPVSSGGNYTDANGQQWVADYVDLARGKYVQCLEKGTYNTGNAALDEEYRLAMRLQGNRAKLGNCKSMFSLSPWTSWTTCVSSSMIYIKNIKKPGSEEYYTAQELKDLNMDFEVLYQLETLIEHDLTPEELEAYKNLTTCAGTTIVENDQDCYMEVSSTTGDTLRAKKLALLLGD